MLIDDKNHYERVFSIDEEGNITSWGLKAKNEEVVIEKKRRELTEQQKKVITHNKELNELSKKLGGFITMYYVKNELLFNKVNISPASISRLIYIATYLDYNDRQNGLLVHKNKYNQLIPMDKKAMKQKLKLTDKTFSRFFKEVKDTSLIFEVEDKIYINPEYFTKGECEFDPGNYTRLYIKTTRELYEGTKVTSHKQLSYIFRLIPMAHYELNVICSNPEEQDLKKVNDLSLDEICELFNIDKSHRTKFKKDMLKYYVTLEGCQYYLFKYVLIEGYYSDHDYFALNPYIIYKGKNPQLVEDIGKLFYFDE